jgi:hypothetical protein
MKDMRSRTKTVVSIASIICNNDTEGKGAAVDLKGYEGALMIFNIGISADTLSGSVLLTPKLQESDTTTDGDFTDVAAGDMLGDEDLTVIDDAAEDPDVQRVSYIGSKRYIRAVVDTTGTHTNGTPLGAVCVLGYPRHMPTS